MRNRLVTPFWQKASRSLPKHVSERYMGELVRAERFDLIVDAWVDLATRVKEFFSHPVRTA